MKKFLLPTGSFTLIFILLPITSANVMLISGDKSNNTIFVNNTNLDISDLIYDIDSRPFNVSYADWTERWWQWAYSAPWDTNPSYDDTGKYCSENQRGQVWYLTLAYEHQVTRTCDIPENTALLMTLLNSECSYAEFPFLRTEEELRECAQRMQDLVVGGNAYLNGVEIPNVKNYRIQSSVFNFTLPENNILDLPPQTTQAVSDGNWIFLKPLPPGNYELKIKGNIKTTTNNETNSNIGKSEVFAGPVGWNYTTTYMLSVK